MTFLKLIFKINKSVWWHTIHPIKKTYYRIKVKSEAYSVGKDLHVNGKSTVTNTTIINNNVNFNGMNIIGKGTVELGNNFHSGPGCIIITSFHDYDHGDAIPYGSSYIHKDVIIKDNVWLGSNVTVLGGVTIGEGAIVQIGSVVVSNIPDFAIAGGHPAIVYKERDVDHYMKLKKMGKVC